MARFGYAEDFSSTRSVQECLQAAHEAMSSVGCKAGVGQDSSDVIGKIGMGWAIRLVGGLIAPTSWFPVKVSVNVRDKDDKRAITVRVDEDFGFGSVVGAEKKMRWRCDDVGKELTRILKSRLV